MAKSWCSGAVGQIHDLAREDSQVTGTIPERVEYTTLPHLLINA